MNKLFGKNCEFKNRKEYEKKLKELMDELNASKEVLDSWQKEYDFLKNNSERYKPTKEYKKEVEDSLIKWKIDCYLLRKRISRMAEKYEPIQTKGDL